mgnify:CR=1 FL=1
MVTRMRVAAYAQAVVEGEDIVITAVGENASPAGGVLSFIDASGHIVRLTPVEPGATQWRIGVGPGPVVQLPTAPPRPPATATVGTEFQFVLDARAVNPQTQEEEPVIVTVSRDGQQVIAQDVNDPSRTDVAVEIDGPTLDLYLRS